MVPLAYAFPTLHAEPSKPVKRVEMIIVMTSFLFKSSFLKNSLLIDTQKMYKSPYRRRVHSMSEERGIGERVHLQATGSTREESRRQDPINGVGKRHHSPFPRNTRDSSPIQFHIERLN